MIAMKISIVTPSFNQSDFLERTLLSVWNQEGDFELEHIVIDGGSTDASVDILSRYDRDYRTGRFRTRCRRMSFSWQSRPDQGQADALNKGFALSTGEILGWLNSDDVLFDTHCLQAVCESFEKHNPDLVVGNVQMMDEQDRALPVPILSNSLDNQAFQKRLPGIRRVSIIAKTSCLFKRGEQQILLGEQQIAVEPDQLPVDGLELFIEMRQRRLLAG